MEKEATRSPLSKSARRLAVLLPAALKHKDLL
jgi:hypothetical protein